MTPVLVTDTVSSDLERALHYALLWGLEGVVLREIGGGLVPYVNEPRTRHRLDEADLPVVALDPGLLGGSAEDAAGWLNDLELLAETAPFAKRVGCRRVLTGSLGEAPWDRAATVRALKQAGGRAQALGVTLAMRNEGHTADGIALAEIFQEVDDPGVRAAWDPAACLAAGADPEEGLMRLRPWVDLVVVRDGEPDGEGWAPSVPGEGGVGWAAQFRLLHQAEFAGPVALEVHADRPGPEGLAHATALIYLLRDAAR